MNNMHNPHRPSIEILELRMREVAGVHNQVLRPLEANMNGSDINTLVERIASSPTHTVNDSTVSGLMGGLVSISATPQGQVGIVNGWTTPRYFFELTVKIGTSLGHSIEVLTGYTEHNEVISMNNLLDPNMYFVVNTVYVKKTYQEQVVNPSGQLVVNQRDAVVDVRTLFNSHAFGQQEFGQGHDLKLITPSSTMSYITASSLVGDSDIYSLDATVSPYAQNTQRQNASPNNYLVNTLSAVVGAIKSNQDDRFPGATSRSDIYATARNNLSGGYPTEVSRFLTIITANRGSFSSVFQLRDLALIDPMIEQKAVIVRIDNFANARALNIDNANHVLGNDIQTMMATIVANTIPSILTKYAFRYASFSATNKNPTGAHDFKYENVLPLGQTAHKPIDMDNLMQSIIGGCLSTISGSMQIPYQIRVSCMIDGLTTVELAMGDDMTMYRYVFPTYADANFSPVVTNRDKAVRDMAVNLANLADAVIDGIDAPNVERTRVFETADLGPVLYDNVPMIPAQQTTVPEGPRGSF